MEKTGTSDGFIISDAITDLGDRFPLKELLALEYFIKYRSDAPKQHVQTQRQPTPRSGKWKNVKDLRGKVRLDVRRVSVPDRDTHRERSLCCALAQAGRRWSPRSLAYRECTAFRA